jgi:hypothetical protein
LSEQFENAHRTVPYLTVNYLLPKLLFFAENDIHEDVFTSLDYGHLIKLGISLGQPIKLIRYISGLSNAGVKPSSETSLDEVAISSEAILTFSAEDVMPFSKWQSSEK